MKPEIQKINPNTTATITLVAQDPDYDDVSFMYSDMQGIYEIANVGPLLKAIDANGNIIQVSQDATYMFNISGTHTLSFLAGDGNNHPVTESVKIDVNSPPTISAPKPEYITTVGKGVYFYFNVSDPDGVSDLATVYGENLPSGAYISIYPYLPYVSFQWTPASDQVGTYDITAVVKDQLGLVGRTTFRVIVNSATQGAAAAASSTTITPTKGRIKK